ncbi:GNAT family N-acetyltransferase [Candidatus Nitrosocosmicus arcticus]|uniref:Putative ribosomal-protein-alanine N-acetyltransferase n=1 Tax=Candidatus Nitrosocosmicus arcticus TaxID=2035267 RepID=A0A557SSI0_9ARCH|nr:N-acetyltransferase [Candidatus Nitrosocosmicus arcticus]TVP39564.1 putative ribosomal-protein-alanine N-acetyltransferase [Candidatus Nitrosocosmicus arcticus]
MQLALREVNGYIIRRCAYEDLNSVISINLKTLPEHYTEYFFESLLREIPEAFIIAEIENVVVGYIMCKLEFGFSNFRKLGFVKKGHVVSIALLQEHRGKNIGEALMMEGINGISTRKGDEIYLEVRTSNGPAISLYQKLGFQIKSVLKSYYRDGEDANLMALELS